MKNNLTIAVRNALANMGIADLVEINNNACKELDPCEIMHKDFVYRKDDFEKVCEELDYTAYDAVRSAYFGGFDPDDSYFCVHPSDVTFWSFSKLGDKNCPFDIDQLTDRIVTHDNAFGNETIRSILDRMKITYTPEQIERIETVYHKLEYALDCLDDLADSISDVSGNAEDGIATAKETNDPHANEYFTRFFAAYHDIGFAMDDICAALATYDKHLGIHTNPSKYNR